MTYTVEYWFEWIVLLGAPFAAGVFLGPKVLGVVSKFKDVFKKKD